MISASISAYLYSIESFSSPSVNIVTSPSSLLLGMNKNALGMALYSVVTPLAEYCLSSIGLRSSVCLLSNRIFKLLWEEKEIILVVFLSVVIFVSFVLD